MDFDGIFVPAFSQRPSGLWVPTDLPVVDAVSAAELPRDLLPDMEGWLAVRAAAPDWKDQVAVYVTAHELGFPRQTKAQIIGAVARLPFERMMLGLGRLQREVGRIGVDLDEHKHLFDQLVPGDSEFKRRVLALVDHAENSVIFSEQALLVLQRLAIQHASAEDRDLAAEDEARFAALIFALPDVFLVLERDLEDGRSTGMALERQFLRYFIASGGLFDSDWTGAAFGRAHMLYSVIAKQPEAFDHHQYCPIDEWMVSSYGVTVAQLQAGGFAITGLGGLYNAEEEPGPLWVVPGMLRDTPLVAHEQVIVDALAGDREWFIQQFMATEGDPRYVARDFRTFYQRPLLRREDGAVLALSPRAVKEALGDRGIYFRIADAAGDGGDRQRFSNFNGWLYERYALRIAQEAFPGSSEQLAATVRVHGEQAYMIGGQGFQTPDVALDCAGHDLVLIEVTSRRLHSRSLIEGDADQVNADLALTLTEKIAQLYNRTDDLIAGAATLPDIDIRTVQRIWPIVVYADTLFLSSVLWDHITRELGDRSTPAVVQPLTLLGMPEYERFLSLSTIMWPVRILERKTQPLWRRRDLGSWISGDSEAPRVKGPPILSERVWAIAMKNVVKTLFPDVDHDAAFRGYQQAQ